jgi:alkylation response protein AidB-like acyl-CoA dehydrogenase
VRETFEDDHAAFAESFRAFVTQDAGESDAVARAGRAGLLGMEVPEEYGGGGVPDPRFCAVAIEELVGAGEVGLALAYAGHVGVGQAVLTRYANREQQTEWLPALVAGESSVAVATEVVSGALGEGGTVALQGGCRAVVNGASAGIALVPVEVGDEVRLAIVKPTGQGIRRISVDGVALTRAGLADFDFDDARVPRSTLLSPPAFRWMLAAYRLWGSVVAITGARIAITWTCAYVRERKVFGRPVAAFENTRQVLGGLSAELSLTQAYIDRCLRLHCTDGLKPTEAAAAKIVGSDLFGRAADQGLQLHGGYGYMREYPISDLFADARFLRWLPEPTEVLRLELASTLEL